MLILCHQQHSDLPVLKVTSLYLCSSTNETLLASYAHTWHCQVHTYICGNSIMHTRYYGVDVGRMGWLQKQGKIWSNYSATCQGGAPLLRTLSSSCFIYVIFKWRALAQASFIIAPASASCLHFSSTIFYIQLTGLTFTGLRARLS